MIRSFNGVTPRIHPSAFISEACYIVGNVEIGENSSVWPGAVIRGDFGSISIGNNSVIQDTCVIHSDDYLMIGDNVLVTHGAVIQEVLHDLLGLSEVQMSDMRSAGAV